MLATCAIDKTVALWDTLNTTTTTDTNSNNANFHPIPCGNKDMNVGKLYCVSFYPSSPWLLGCGGSGNQLALWDLESEEAFRSRFGSRIVGGGGSSNYKTMTGDDNKEETPQEEDFEAIMAANDQATGEAKAKAILDKKKKGKSKKKVHKKR